jgi:hypothetical protein
MISALKRLLWGLDSTVDLSLPQIATVSNRNVYSIRQVKKDNAAVKQEFSPWPKLLILFGGRV